MPLSPDSRLRPRNELGPQDPVSVVRRPVERYTQTAFTYGTKIRQRARSHQLLDQPDRPGIDAQPDNTRHQPTAPDTVRDHKIPPRHTN